MTSVVAAWEARAEVSVAVLIRRYLRENPPPAPTRIADDFAEWAERLEEDGRARLCEVGGRPLAVARCVRPDRDTDEMEER